MKEESVKIETYHNIDLYYDKSDGDIFFKFEGKENRVKYVFEARKIIDKPIWEPCDLEGYFVDGYIDKYIGLAKATKKDRKSGNPDWKYKSQYDVEYKYPSYSDRGKKIYLKNKHNDDVYEEWKKQREVYIMELRKLNNITGKLR